MVIMQKEKVEVMQNTLKTIDDISSTNFGNVRKKKTLQKDSNENYVV